jgi:hypothetical protein
VGGRDVRTHWAETVESLRWGLAVPEVDGLVGVVCSGMLDTSWCCGAGTLIDSRLHLFQELIDVHEIVLGPEIWHGW